MAFHLLTKWDHSQRHAQDLIGEAFDARRALAPKDKALAQHLVFGVLDMGEWLGHMGFSLVHTYSMAQPSAQRKGL